MLKFLLLFYPWVDRIPFALVPVFLLAAQPAAISLLGPQAKINHNIKMET